MVGVRVGVRVIASPNPNPKPTLTFARDAGEVDAAKPLDEQWLAWLGLGLGLESG